MADYSWNTEDELVSHRIPSDEIPARFALTSPQYILRNSGSEFLLIDPHPAGSWMSWMFPYASLILDNTTTMSAVAGYANLTSGELTFGGLSDFLKSLREDRHSDYIQNILNEVNNTIPGISEGWNGVSVYENYSLKYSKTSESYTAYVFEYFLSHRDDLDLEIPHLWVPVDSATRLLGDIDFIGARTVSSNVVDFVHSTVR